jgi:hypothetical protein
VVVAFVVFTPVFTIWALNTLFGFAIVVTWKTYLAALWLSALVGGGAVKVAAK